MPNDIIIYYTILTFQKFLLLALISAENSDKPKICVIRKETKVAEILSH